MLNKFNKLIRHEYGQTSKQFLPIFAALVAMVLLTTIFIAMGGMPMRASVGSDFESVTHQGTNDMLNRVLRIVTTFFFSMTLFGLIAFITAVFVMSIMRFYKNMLGDEGYLMFTLPVTPVQHLLAKLMVAVTWTVSSIALAILSLLLFVSAGTDGAIWGEIGRGLSSEALGTQAALFPWTLLVSAIVGIIFAYLMLYLCMAIGAQWMQNRLLASIVAYVALSTAQQVLGTVLLAVFGNAFGSQIMMFFKRINPEAFSENATAESVFGLLNILLLIAVAVSALCGVVYFFVTKHLLTKKLNLA